MAVIFKEKDLPLTDLGLDGTAWCACTWLALQSGIITVKWSSLLCIRLHVRMHSHCHQETCSEPRFLSTPCENVTHTAGGLLVTQAARCGR